MSLFSDISVVATNTTAIVAELKALNADDSGSGTAIVEQLIDLKLATLEIAASLKAVAADVAAIRDALTDAPASIAVVPGKPTSH